MKLAVWELCFSKPGFSWTQERGEEHSPNIASQVKRSNVNLIMSFYRNTYFNNVSKVHSLMFKLF